MSNKELISALIKQNAELKISNNELQSQLTIFQQEILEWKAELAWYKSNRNSNNSHLSPKPRLYKHASPKRKRKKSSRNPGGQHGHCPKCGRHSASELPGMLDYIDAQYGDNLKNLVTYLSTRQFCQSAG